MSALPITVPSERIADFCRRNHICKLSFFGSVLTPRFRADSDVDFLVEFEPGVPVSYFDLVGKLSEVIGRKVDLRTPDELSRYFRDKVVRQAIVQYER